MKWMPALKNSILAAFLPKLLVQDVSSGGKKKKRIFKYLKYFSKTLFKVTHLTVNKVHN